MMLEKVINTEMEKRYERAQILYQGLYTKNIARNDILFPHWINGTNCFWYVRDLEEGKEYRLVNSDSRTNEVAFDHIMLAKALSKSTNENIESHSLPIKKVEIKLVPLEITFSAFGKRWVYKDGANICDQIEDAEVVPGSSLSPDGKQIVFMKDYNIWVRNIDNGEERPLTKDGEEFFTYGEAPDGWGGQYGSTNIQGCWSPDGKLFFTLQTDLRSVKTVPLVEYVPKDGSIRPKIRNMKRAFPGDENVPESRLLVIDVESAKIQEVNYRRIQQCKNGYGYFDYGFGWWAKDSRRAYFVDLERGEQVVRVVVLDVYTGDTRILFEEKSDTQITLFPDTPVLASIIPLPETDELIWMSERSGWAHLYLYDLETGTEKHSITQGAWRMGDLLHFDIERRELYVQTSGRIPDQDPYYRDFCRINIDTGKIFTLMTGNYDYDVISMRGRTLPVAHAIGIDDGTASGISPNSNFFITTRCRVDQAATTVLLDRNGEEILELETADVSALPEGWQWPESVKLLAADGKTDIYGVVFRPSNFSPDQSYPVISIAYNSPETFWAVKGSFASSYLLGYAFYDSAALAELGCIVVQIDGRGTPGRGKAFRDESYGSYIKASLLEDHVAGIKQLADRYPYMDIERVGISAHQGGGAGGITGLLEYPEFFKVGVCGLMHDSRFMPAFIGDKYDGVDGLSEGNHYPEELVENLQGKLLLMHGMLDHSCPVSSTFRIIEALQKANKDFDMIVLPNVPHDVVDYQIRRAWDYFVEHLFGEEPPKEFKFTRVVNLR